jgi:hypothetical protein
VKNVTLNRVAELVNGKVDSMLPEVVANYISNPDVNRKLEERIEK